MNKRMNWKNLLAVLVLALAAVLPLYAAAALPQPDTPILRLATTTSTDNSGLLKVILPVFEAATGYRVHVIAVGTGKALKMGESGDVDVILVHARSAEEAFVAAGHGPERHAVMYNDFILVGPEDDPAGIRGMADTELALKKIAQAQAVFVSRGDDSGTHKKERQLWASAAIQPEGSWYREVGQGMGKALQIAGQLDAYTMTDRGTWLAYRDKSRLQVVLEGDPPLFNPYGIIAVSATKYPDVNRQGAQTLIDWLTSAQGQQLIGDFKISGQQLFVPNANAEAPAKTAAAQ